MSKPLTSDQIFQFYEAILKALLGKHNPEGLNTITPLLKQFPGKEHMVYVQICKKCGVVPRRPPTPDDFIDGVPKVLTNPEVSGGRVSKWLAEHKFEKYAKQNQFQTMSWEKFIGISSKGKLIELGVIPEHSQSLLLAILQEAEKGNDKLNNDKLERKADFEVGENCFTKVIGNEQGLEKWLNARITEVNADNTFDIFVYNSKGHGVPPEAVSVPRNMLKKSSEKVQVAEPKKRTAKRPQFQHGDRVRVFGLRSHTSYNNLCGTVLLYVPNERRYQVRLDTNDLIAIKQRNVTAEDSNPEATAPVESDKKIMKKEQGVKDNENSLTELMIKLMKDNPNADPGKLGEFAAGYILAKQKLSNS